jgi:aminoacrylate hydrolase
MGEIAGLYYEEHGPAGAPPLILSAGLGGSAAYWAPNLEALTRENRVILYDHRGTGRSDRATLGLGYDADDMARDVVLLMDGLGIARASLIGHAAGGIIGLTLALFAPERLDRLVVVNGFAKPDAHFLNCMDVREALLRDSGVSHFLRAQPIFLYPSRWISEHRDWVDAEQEYQHLNFQGRENFVARVNALCEFEIDTCLHEIPTPTLLIAAEDDMLVTPTNSELLAAGIPGATLAMMSGGHACNVTESERFNQILAGWLAPARLQGAA